MQSLRGVICFCHSSLHQIFFIVRSAENSLTTASAPVSDVSAPACTNGVWPPLRLVRSIDLPMDCMAWRFWTMRQPNGCSTPVLRSSATKQWFEQVSQNKKNCNWSQKSAEVTWSTFQRFRSHAPFFSFWEKTVQQAQDLQLTDPRIPRARGPKNGNLAGHVLHSARRKIMIVWYTSTLPTASVVKYQSDSIRKILFFMQNARNCWFRLQTGCVIAENLEAVKKNFGDDLEASRLSNQLGVLSNAVQVSVWKWKT